MRICGIDPSISSTGIAILDAITENDTTTFELIDKVSLINKKTFKDRWAKKEVTRELFEFYLRSKISEIDFFVFEDYSFASIGYLADAGEMIGQFKHYLWLNKKPFDRIPPATVKKLIAGDGRADKSLVSDCLSKFVVNIKSFNFNNYDETDAMAIAIAFLLNINKNASIRREDKECIEQTGLDTKRRRTK